MKFQNINVDNIELKDLLKIMDSNHKIATKMRKDIEKLLNLQQQSYEYSGDIESREEEKMEITSVLDEDFEDEVDYYLTELNSLTRDNIEDRISSVLPVRKNYNYRRIIIRLQLEAIKEIKDIEELLRIEYENISLEELRQFRQEIELENLKVNLLEKALKNEIIEVKEKLENKLIFVPTTNGNIRILSELEKIPRDYDDSFRELFLSIKEGTFKNVKRFNNNKNINGVCEVKGDGTRVIFARIGKNTYVVITAFLKKTMRDKAYSELLKRKVNNYFLVENFLRANLDNEDFLQLNEEYEKELFAIISANDSSCKKKVLNND